MSMHPKKTSSSRGSAKITSGGHSNAARYKRRIISQHGYHSESSDSSSGQAFCRPIQREPRRESDTKSAIAALPSQQDVANFFSNNKNCCANGTKEYCCLESSFLIGNNGDGSLSTSTLLVDSTQLYQFIVALRSIPRQYSNEELDQYFISEVRRCVSGRRQFNKDASGTESDGGDNEDHYVYNWTLEIKAAGKRAAMGPFKVCRKVFAYVLGMTTYQIKRIVISMKESEFGYLHSSKVRQLTDHSRYFEGFSFDQVEEVMRNNVTMRVNNDSNEHLTLGTFEIDPEMVRAALTPMSESDRYCIYFLQKYSLIHGDAAPNDFERALDQGTIQNQYASHYVPAAMDRFVKPRQKATVSSNSAIKVTVGKTSNPNDSDSADSDIICENELGGPVGYARFCELWRVVFPDLVNRPYRSIMGKCKWCGLFDAGRKTSENEAKLKYFTYAHLLHRGGCVMKERGAYYRRREEAESPENLAYPRILSMIIDLEDSSKTGLPYLGKEATFGNPLEHHLTGVKIHGDHAHFFPTMNTVGKSANLTCYCILRTINMFYEKHNRFPEVIYIQIDGGSENANETVLALCELLVIKRFAKVLHLTRLPPGHTHDDIDAIFGVIWKYYHRGKVYLTIEDFQEGAKRAFKATNLSIEFEELIYLVPDYESWLAPCIDTKLSGLFKQEKTMLCHKWVSVVPSVYFPLGVKWTYRAFWSDWVIEFIQKHEDQCISPIGRYTGLEPVMTLSVWHPAKDYDPNRPVEGIYILRDLPAQVSRIHPAKLKKDCHASLNKTWAEICYSPTFELKGRNAKASLWWDSWFRLSMPPASQEAVEYESQLISRGVNLTHNQPFKEFLYDPNWVATIAQGACWVQSRKLIDEDGLPQWMAELGLDGLGSSRRTDYGMAIMISGNSVESDFNPNPVHPRLFTANDLELERLVQNYSSICNDAQLYEYGSTSQSSMLASVNMRKVSIDADFETAAQASTRPGLITRMKRFDLEFLVCLHRTLSKADSIFINSFLAMENRDAWAEGPGCNHRGAEALWSPLQVPKSTLFRLVSTGPDQTPLIAEDFSFILQMFELRDGFMKTIGARRLPPVNYRPSVFQLQRTWSIYSSVFNLFGDIQRFTNWHRAYFLISHFKAHILVVLQADSKTFSIIKHTEPGSIERAGYDNAQLYELFMHLNGPLITAGWKRGSIGPVNNLLHFIDSINVMESKHAGVYLIYVIYFLLLDVPVYFDPMDIRLRENLAYYCIKGNLPF